MQQMTSQLKKLAFFVSLLLAIMVTGLVYGLMHGNFSSEVSHIAAMPWGLVTFIDIYIGFLLIGVWIFWREVSTFRALLFFVPILFLGNFFTCIYILYAIFTSSGDIQKFINGKRTIT